MAIGMAPIKNKTNNNKSYGVIIFRFIIGVEYKALYKGLY